MDNTPTSKGQPGLAGAALFGLCPRCGSKTLFASVIRFTDKCRACGLDIGAFNVGDGPAAFLTLIVGAIITLLAVTVELAVEPPIWVHVLLWVPLTAAAVIYGLRVGKAALLAIEYRQRAGEGRLRDGRPEEDGE